MYKYILYIIIGLLLLVLFSVILFLEYSNTNETTIIVKDKYVKGEEGLYIVVDTNNNIYKIKDLLLIGKFNSSDIYNQLEVGKSYNIKTSGYRIHILSDYPNINEIN